METVMKRKGPRTNAERACKGCGKLGANKAFDGRTYCWDCYDRAVELDRERLETLTAHQPETTPGVDAAFADGDDYYADYLQRWAS